MEITLQGKTYTIDDAEALQQAITQLEIDSSTYQAENQGLKTKLDQLESQLTQKNDSSVDYDQLVGERLELWGQVLPHLRQDDESFMPDYRLSPLQIKVTYLNSLKHDNADWKEGLQERKDELISDSPSPTTIAFVNGLYSVLKPGSVSYQKKSHTDEVLESIMFGRHQGTLHTDTEEVAGTVTKIDHRAELTKKLQSKNPVNRKQAS